LARSVSVAGNQATRFVARMAEAQALRADNKISALAGHWCKRIKMTDYRRGLVEGKAGLVWQKLWHFSPQCDHYPTRNFEAQRDRPSDDDLCAKCQAKPYAD
jgi:hypothetical protein